MVFSQSKNLLQVVPKLPILGSVDDYVNATVDGQEEVGEATDMVTPDVGKCKKAKLQKNHFTIGANLPRCLLLQLYEIPAIKFKSLDLRYLPIVEYDNSEALI